MKNVRHERETRPASTGSAFRRAALVLMSLAALGLVAALLLGAPLVSVFLIGLLLLCPLLMWVPFRFERRALEGSVRAKPRHG